MKTAFVVALLVVCAVAIPTVTPNKRALRATMSAEVTGKCANDDSYKCMTRDDCSSKGSLKRGKTCDAADQVCCEINDEDTSSSSSESTSAPTRFSSVEPPCAEDDKKSCKTSDECTAAKGTATKASCKGGKVCCVTAAAPTRFFEVKPACANDGAFKCMTQDDCKSKGTTKADHSCPAAGNVCCELKAAPTRFFEVKPACANDDSFKCLGKDDCSSQGSVTKGKTCDAAEQVCCELSKTKSGSSTSDSTSAPTRFSSVKPACANDGAFKCMTQDDCKSKGTTKADHSCPAAGNVCCELKAAPTRFFEVKPACVNDGKTSKCTTADDCPGFGSPSDDMACSEAGQVCCVKAAGQKSGSKKKF